MGIVVPSQHLQRGGPRRDAAAEQTVRAEDSGSDNRRAIVEELGIGYDLNRIHGVQ